ncbi:hypothetical protein Ga0466249_000789 [Sporomusaceae bacterium BoRhaA]|uniref:ClbS/DfsB family four-helix bundle protein n=1 Tax=Pelorhabdus rhamnosifermentans TaxID=2772457 RepID=UPI001C06309E|nr:ClbS/DfsB family four-helix bundle protein [Pelorhabdus rhamnosifermentans]MBU2699708.1 hypothetical protein [Pelorhabdus rhamnosifermentans]
MQEYDNKVALIDAIKKTYQLFDREFDEILEEKKDIRIKEVDKTPQEMIVYQLGWLNLIMGWENDELNGKEVVTPSRDYKWNQLGQLYQSFYAEYSGYSLKELRNLFKESIEMWCDWIGQLSDEELFTPNVRKWTVTRANWPMWKWVHINSVAPFKSFRTKIRKWKNLTETI